MRLSKYKPYLIVLYVLVLAVIIIIPMLTRNDIITTIKSGTDMSAHLAVIQGIANGQEVYTTYFGQKIIGYLLSPFANSSHLETIYLWFSFAVLFGACVTMFFVVRKIFNLTSALLVIPMMLFCTSGIISLFRYGVIFNIINMYIIFPLAVYYLVKWMDKKKLVNLFVSIILFGLFTIFHVSSFYLVGGLGLLFLLSVGYLFYKKNVGKGFALLVIGVFFGVIVLYLTRIFFGSWILPQLSLNLDLAYSIPMLARHLSITVIVLVIITLIVLFKDKLFKSLEKQHVYLLTVLACFVVAISGAVLLGISSNILFINRFMVDATTLIAIGTACLLGFVLSHYKNKALNWLTSILVIGGSIPALTMWCK